MTKCRIFAFEVGGTCSNSVNQSGRMDGDTVELESLPKCSSKKIRGSFADNQEMAGHLTHVINIDERSGPFALEVNAHLTADRYMDNSAEIEMESPNFKDNFSHAIYPDKHAKKGTYARVAKRSDDYFPVFNISEFFRDDEDLVKYKRTKIAFNVHGAIPVLIFQFVVFATRASLYRPVSINMYFSCAFTISVFAIGIFMLLLSVILLERFTDPVCVKESVDVVNTNQHSDVSHSTGSHCPDMDDDIEQSAFPSNKKNVAGVSASFKRKQGLNGCRGSKEMRTAPFSARLNACLNRTIHHWVFQEAFDAMAISGSFAIGKISRR